MKGLLTPLIYSLGLFVVSFGQTQAALVIDTDDFSSGSIGNTVRLRSTNADGGWQADFGTNSGNPSNWQITNGELVNEGNVFVDTTPADGVPDDTRRKFADGPVAAAYSITTTDTSLTEITFTFDYDVGTGTTTYFHAWGLIDDQTNINNQILNTQANNGGVQNQAEGNFTDINLFDGSDPNGGTGGAIALTGSGTFTMTYDLTQGPGVNSIADYDFISVAFANEFTNFDGSGAVRIDNFSIVAIPEPTSWLVIFGLAVMGSFLRRRRHR